MNDNDTGRPHGARPADPSDSGAATRGGPPRPALIGAGVIAAVVLVLLAVFLLRPDESAVSDASPSPTAAPTTSLEPGASAATPSIPATASASPAPTSTPTLSAFDVTWSETAWPEDTGVHHVMFDPELELWVATGGRSIWTSPDAIEWTASSVESAGCDAEQDHCAWAVVGVVRLGDRLVAAGGIASSSSDASALASWESTDGLSWTLGASGTSGTGQYATVAASNGTALYATPILTDAEGGTVFHTSTDGASWERSMDADDIKIFEVHGDSDGFVGVGSELEDRLDYSTVRPIVRRSADGHNWTTVTVGASNGDRIEAVTRLPSGRYLAAGSTDEGQLIVWASNGADAPWTVTRLGNAAGLPVNRATPPIELASGPRGAVLAITTPDGPGLYTSVEGETWQAIAMPPGPAPLVLAVIGIHQDTVVAFGGPANPENGGNAGLPFGSWLGVIRPSFD